MDAASLILETVPGTYSVCRFAAEAKVPDWAVAPGVFASITRTRDELSIICAEGSVPTGTTTEAGLRILKVQGTLDFSLTGILAAIAAPLAAAKVSIFAVSTFDTDYVLVPGAKFEVAIAALGAAGHSVKVE